MTDPAHRSWVASANEATTDFPLQNLPFGVHRRRGGAATIGVAIGDRILDVPGALRAGLLPSLPADVAETLGAATLNQLMALGRPARQAVRAALLELLSAGNSSAESRATQLLVPMSDADLLLPAHIGDYSDFYASIHHATNVGSMFRPDNPLLPNYRWIPIGYHGRASSIVVSGTEIRRPSGQTRDDANAPPAFGPSKRLDYELELGVYVGPGNAPGAPIGIADAEDHLWGVCLVNDWSARDIQAWEYQPLGPFLSKSFATTVSPWVVTLDALEPYRVSAATRNAGDPQPLPYLSSDANTRRGGIDVTLEVWIQSRMMRERGLEPMLVSRGSFAEMYWTLAQMLTHHASNGCNLRAGDLLGSGTVSGAAVESRGCLLERTWRGTDPLELPDGEKRAFLQDGDEVILRGYAARDGLPRIGLGECRGRISG